MRVLGISPAHDSSVCLINDGVVEYFYKEERFSKVKRDKNPLTALSYINEKGLDIDLAVFCSPTNNDEGTSFFENYCLKHLKVKRFEDMSHEHHLQHASLAFYDSGFEKSLVFVIDRNGSYFYGGRESESVFVAEYPYDFTLLYKSAWVENKNQKMQSYNHSGAIIDVLTTHGITRVYESATRLIQQHGLENGKTMGLAAYGEESNLYKNLFLYDNIGNYNILEDDEEHFAINKNIQNISRRNITKENYKIYADYAYAVQKQTQEAVLGLVKKYVEKTKIDNVCITGGYGLNVVANGYLREQLPNVNFFFEPIADDTGNSIGGAKYGFYALTKSRHIEPLSSTFFNGENYSLENVKGVKTNIKSVVDKIISGATMGLYYGLSEAGPRALGHRSILFDARNKNAKEIVNVVKQREWYRPFAGVMLEEDANKYFYNVDANNSKYMTINYKAKPEAKKDIPGVLHIDNTCRIQIISDIKEPLYKLLCEFKKQTGVGVLLNTSLNLAGKPLVETPEDAVEILNNSSLSCMWFPEKNILAS